MYKYKKILAVFGLLLFLLSRTVFASSIPVSSLQKLRFSQTSDHVRIVFDVSEIPDYIIDRTQDGQIIINLSVAADPAAMTTVQINNDIVNSFRLISVDELHQQLVISLKGTTVSEVFSLKDPNRLVVDLIKNTPIHNIPPVGQIDTPIAPGLIYTTIVQQLSSGPIAAYVLDADLSKFKLVPVLGNNPNIGLDKVKDMEVNDSGIAAVNGSYFAPNGEILGLLKINNDIVSIPEFKRTAVGITEDNKYIFGQVCYQGTVRLPDGSVLPISGINCERAENTVTLYNSYYGKSTKTNEYGKDYVMTNGKVRAILAQDAPINFGSVVLSAHGTAAAAMSSLKVGDSIDIKQSLGSEFDKVSYAMGAGPMLVKDGEPFLTTQAEQFPDDIAVGRAPRTALGITKSGHILLVVVDGRQTTSIGMTLVELADFMQKLGAVEAMNFDGGGSSEMVVRDSVMNNPSDGQERSVGEALVLINR
ncbi:MAG: Protein of unknown function periplasmic [Firmicutes bacterium]|nr:Protein of unknown function periplasmic [Bacillota bacterium]